MSVKRRTNCRPESWAWSVCFCCAGMQSVRRNSTSTFRLKWSWTRTTRLLHHRPGHFCRTIRAVRRIEHCWQTYFRSFPAATETPIEHTQTNDKSKGSKRASSKRKANRQKKTTIEFNENHANKYGENGVCVSRPQPMVDTLYLLPSFTDATGCGQATVHWNI